MKTSPFLAASVAPDEVAHFSKCADEWWSKRGIFGVLHDLTPLRVSYIKAQAAKYFSKKNKPPIILDIGCGGGLIAESLCQEGAKIVGIDASEQAIAVARAHAAQNSLVIDYRVASAEEMAMGQERFDIILALEIIEHVADLDSFIKALAQLLKPDGVVIFSTINRTRLGFLLGVVAAEYILGWVPLGTHDYDKFVRPSELAKKCEKNGLTPTDVTGLVFRPFRRVFELCKGKTKVNYFLTAKT